MSVSLSNSFSALTVIASDWEFRFATSHLTAVHLHLMRERHYHSALGLFVGRDPIRYADVLSFYAYAAGDPLNRTDPMGLAPVGCCGLDITAHLRALKAMVPMKLGLLTRAAIHKVCFDMINTGDGFDVEQLVHSGRNPLTDVFKDAKTGCGSGLCGGSVTVCGRCNWAAEVNYYLMGVAAIACTIKTGASRSFTLSELALRFGAYRLGWYFGRHFELFNPWGSLPYGRDSGSGFIGRFHWASMGRYDFDPCDSTRDRKRCTPCKLRYSGTLHVKIGRPPGHVLQFKVTNSDAKRYEKR